MSAPSWERVQELFSHARALPEAERQAWLQAQCADDAALLREVTSLLANDRTEPIFEPPRRLPSALAPISPQAAKAPDAATTELIAGLRNHRATLIVLGVAIVALMAVGVLTRNVMEREITESLQGQLQAVRNLAAMSLEEWLEDEHQVLSRAAAEDGLAATATALIELGGDYRDGVERRAAVSGFLDEARAQANSAVLALDATVQRQDHDGWALISRDGLLLAAGGRITGERAPNGPGDHIHPDNMSLVSRVFEGQSIFVPPTQTGGEGQLEARPYMAMAEPVRRPEDGSVVAALAFVLDPEGRFTDTLTSARMGHSGETYAFDRQGRLLSSSLFEPELRQVGLLPEGVDSALALHVTDPGGNLLTGYPLKGQSPDFALTVAAARARDTRQPGLDFEGYRDYRGVTVVGAWTWLEPFGFGIVTEIDREEAHAPLTHLTYAFAVLLGLVAAGVAGVLIAVGKAAHLAAAFGEVRKLGQYHLVEVLGQGGMGTVYRAEHALLKRSVAIKLVRRDRTDDENARRIAQEVELSSQLTHPNTIEIYDCGIEAQNRLYYVMEYLDGITVYDLVTGAGPLPPGRVVHLMRQAASSLREAHNKGLVHRDIKPANLMVCERGGIPDVIKVLDFGLVKDMTPQAGDRHDTEYISGTPLYMAPERLRNEAVDGRADLFALGATAYVMLTGRQAHAGRTPAEMAAAVLNDEPTAPARHAPHPIPKELDQLVLALLARDRDQRPADADAVLAALDRVPGPVWTEADARRFWDEEGPRLRQAASTRRLSITQGS